MLDIESHAHHLTVISQIGYLSNTMIFIIAGAVIFELFSGVEYGSIPATPANPEFIAYALDPSYWLDLLKLYLALTAIRGIAIALLWPILRKLGYGFDFKTFLLLIWGGLRGYAISFVKNSAPSVSR